MKIKLYNNILSKKLESGWEVSSFNDFIIKHNNKRDIYYYYKRINNNIKFIKSLSKESFNG